MIIDAGRVMLFWFTAIAFHVFHAAVVIRVQGRSVDEILEGGAFCCDGVMLVYHVIEGADLVDVSGEAGLGLMQFREGTGFQGKGGYAFEGEAGVDGLEVCGHRT